MPFAIQTVSNPQEVNHTAGLRVLALNHRQRLNSRIGISGISDKSKHIQLKYLHLPELLEPNPCDILTKFMPNHNGQALQ
eukprot:3964754-Amphidinium_carterae.2